MAKTLRLRLATRRWAGRVQGRWGLLSMRAQLTLIVVLGQALMMVLLAWYMHVSQQRQQQEASQQHAQGMAQSLALGAATDVAVADVTALQTLVSGVAQVPGVAYAMVVDAQGRVLAHSDRRLAGHSASAALLETLRTAPSAPVVMYSSGERTDVAAPVPAPQHGWALVALHRGSTDAPSRWPTVLGFLALGALLSVGVGGLITRRFSLRMGGLLQTLEQLRMGERGVRLEVDHVDELGQLAEHVNAMLADLERQESDAWRRSRELDIERTRLVNIIEGTQIGTWEWNVQTGGVIFNRRWADMLGHTLEELQPLSIKTWETLTHPDDLIAAQTQLTRHFNGEVSHYECQLRLRHKEGHWVWVLDRGRVAEWTDEGKPLWMFGTHQDISTQKEAELELRRATDLAEKAARAKGDFLANMSHEIRTPMNAVIGIAHLLERSTLDADQRQLLTKLQTASRTLLNLINDVLDLGKIEAGMMTLESIEFSPTVLLTEVQDMFRPQAEQKGLTFETEGEDELPQQLAGDVVRLRQIVCNLVSNAIKFTDRGRVALHAEAQLDDDGARFWLHVAVTDTGCGIAESDQARLFTPFTQGDASTTRRFGGTGLGLSIVQRLVALMGGSHGFTSTPGRGSCFWVRVPMALAVVDVPLPMPEVMPPPPPIDVTTVEAESWPAQRVSAVAPDDVGVMEHLPGVRVLVVDDSPINLDVARRLLQAEGAEVHSCINGREAVEYLRLHPDWFDAVLMDIQMPEMDGYEATRRVRGELGLAQLPIVAVTAGALVEDRWRAMAAGMDGFLSKPLDPALLINTVRQWVERYRGQAIVLRPHANKRDRDRGAEGGSEPMSARAAPRPWPTIEGIDISDVRRRLGGELELFTTLLSHLFDEFGWLADESAAQQALHNDRGALMARVHKLRGAAGMLGARQLHQQAGEVELELQAEHDDSEGMAGPHRAVARLSQLAHTLGHLMHTAKPALQSLQRPIGGAVQASASGDQEGHRALLYSVLPLLKAQDLAALDQMAHIEAAVLALGGESLLACVQQAMQGLDFAGVAAALEQALGAPAGAQ
jgi:PAS domain S-box-containing protein